MIALINNNKKYIIIGIVLIALVVTSILLIPNISKSTTVYNVPLKTAAVINGLEITVDNVTYSESDGISTINGIIKNTNSSDSTLETFQIELYDKDEKILENLTVYMDQTIKADAEKPFNASVDKDISTATTTTITLAS